MKKIFIIGSSKGIGNAIYKKINKKKYKIYAPKRNILDTSNIEQVINFIKKIKKIDILVFNTGGPPKKSFYEIKYQEWIDFHNQLFLSFALILQNIKINKNGYIFLISSHTIKNPEDQLVLSNCYRLAASSLLKTYSNINAKNNISCINIAPGPVKTNRLKNLVKDLKKFEKKLPMLRAGDPKEIGNFVNSIVDNNIKYLNGVTINFDGGLSRSIF